MRTVFNKALLEIARENPRIFMILADIGYGEIEPFAKEFPDRFFNVGVAEQNMTGIACGVAMEGNIAITYSIANFPTLRCLEQIRNDVCYHNANVKIVIIGGGLAYGSLGVSHHATEDIAIMRAIPNMKVFAPGDTVEAYHITKKIITEISGPVYLRLGRAGEATIHSEESIKKIILGKGFPLIESSSKELALLSTGGMLETAVNVSAMLKEKGIESSVYSFHTIKPMN